MPSATTSQEPNSRDSEARKSPPVALNETALPTRHSEGGDLLAKLPWPNPAGETQILPGVFSKVTFNIRGTRENAQLSALAIEATSERGEPLLRFELSGQPSLKLQRALVNLIAPAHASKNVDTYLNDIRILVQTDPNLSWKRTIPASPAGTEPVKPMRPFPMEFPEFMADPSRARNVFFCSAAYNNTSTTLVGEVRPLERIARITLVESDIAGRSHSESSYVVNPTRHEARNAGDWHRHLKTRLWEAMEVFWYRGKDTFHAMHGSGESRDVLVEKVLAKPSSKCSLEERLFRGESALLNPTFCKTTPAGTVISLEIGTRQSLLAINVKPTSGDESFIAVIDAPNNYDGFSEKEIAELKLLANAMCKADFDTREQATLLMLGKIFRHTVGSPLDVSLSKTIHAFSNRLSVSCDPWAFPPLCELMLRGYQPAFLKLPPLHTTDPISMIFPSMFVAYNREGELLVELVGSWNQRITFETHGDSRGRSMSNSEIVRSVCEVFAQQPSASWYDVVSTLSALSAAHPGSGLNLKSRQTLCSLPPLNEAVSVRAFENAAALLTFCRSNNPNISPESMITYVERGKAWAVIRPYDSSVAMVVSIKNDTITDISLYPANPLEIQSKDSRPFAKQTCHLHNLHSEGIQTTIAHLSSLIYETFATPQGAPYHDASTLRSKWAESALPAALACLGRASQDFPEVTPRR